MKNKKESSGQLSLFEDLEEKKSAFEIIDGKKSCDSSSSNPDLLLRCDWKNYFLVLIRLKLLPSHTI